MRLTGAGGREGILLLTSSTSSTWMNSSTSPASFPATLQSCSATSTTMTTSTNISVNTKVSETMSCVLLSLMFLGKCCILIGPIDGARHCDPEPDYLMDSKDWTLLNSYSLKEEDKISIYIRAEKN